MKTPQHLFALTSPEQRVVLLIVVCLLLGTAFARYHDAAGKPLQVAPAQTTPASKASTDENQTEEE
jgi:hypothetical protein